MVFSKMIAGASIVGGGVLASAGFSSAVGGAGVEAIGIDGGGVFCGSLGFAGALGSVDCAFVGGKLGSTLAGLAKTALVSVTDTTPGGITIIGATLGGVELPISMPLGSDLGATGAGGATA